MARSIAVVMPAYNAEQYIEEALESIARQSRTPDQIIVVDDGSRDATVACVRAWTRKTGLDVELLEQENRGPAAARNLGIRQARTDLIALLDADDVYLPHHLGLVSQAFAREEQLVLCFGDSEIFSNEGIVNPSLLGGTAVETLGYDERSDGLRLFRGSAYSSLVRSTYIPVGATIFRREAAEAIGLFDERFRGPEDRDFCLRLSRVGRFGYYSTIVARKRVHQENLTHAKHRMQYRRYQLAVILKMLRQSEELKLRPEEIQETRAALAEHASIMLYHASERGLGPFLDTCGFCMTRRVIRPLLTPKHWWRALAFSTVRQKRFR